MLLLGSTGQGTSSGAVLGQLLLVLFSNLLISLARPSWALTSLEKLYSCLIPNQAGTGDIARTNHTPARSSALSAAYLT